MNSIAFLGEIWQDLRYSFRVMRKSPTFTMTAVLTLALGIGGNTAMFTVIRGVLLKPLQYHNQERLVRLSLEDIHGQERDGSFTLPRLEEMRASARSFSAIGAYLKFTEEMSLSGHGGPEALKVARVSANFLDILGERPIAGRSFFPEEDTPEGPLAAMISSRLWKRRFGGDPADSRSIHDAEFYVLHDCWGLAFRVCVSFYRHGRLGHTTSRVVRSVTPLLARCHSTERIRQLETTSQYAASTG